MEMPKVPVESRYFVAYVESFVAVAPFFRAKVAPFFQAKDRLQTGTVKFFDKALCKLAGMKDTYSAPICQCIARPLLGTSCFLPSIARITQRTPRRPRLTVVMGHPGEDEEDVAERSGVRVFTDRTRPTTRAGNEARSAQLFPPLSDIAWYIAGAG